MLLLISSGVCIRVFNEMTLAILGTEVILDSLVLESMPDILKVEFHAAYDIEHFS